MIRMYHADRRSIKRYERKCGYDHPVYLAHVFGEVAAHRPHDLPPRLRRNPYPPGRRHDTYNAAYESGIRDLY